MLKTTTPTTMHILCKITGQWTIGEIADILELSDDVLSVSTGLDRYSIVNDHIELRIETRVPQIFQSEEWFEAVHENKDGLIPDFSAVSITPIVWLVTFNYLSDVGIAPDYHAFADYDSMCQFLFGFTGTENTRDLADRLSFSTPSDDVEIIVSALPLSGGAK